MSDTALETLYFVAAEPRKGSGKKKLYLSKRGTWTPNPDHVATFKSQAAAKAAYARAWWCLTAPEFPSKRVIGEVEADPKVYVATRAA
jgi:hypothetical protein